MPSPVIPHPKSAPDISGLPSSNALIEARYRGSSPYYKGLTDFSLDINREKQSGSSPGRESRATSYVTAGSKSSLTVKVQEWGGSCFSSKKDGKSSSSSFSSLSKSSHDNRLTTSSSSSSSRVMETEVLTKISTKTTENEPVSVKKRVTIQSTKIEDTINSQSAKKPLRERDSGPPPMQPLSPPIASPPASLPYPLPVITPPTIQPSLSPPPPQAILHPSCSKEGLEAENERKYTWSDKYRPFWLQDFLCNKEKALWLKMIVQSWKVTQEECGQFIFEGNPGVGKRTMICALLREAFGPGKVQARKEIKKFYFKGEAVSSITVNLMVSPQHVEVNLSDLKGYEKHVIVELIKENSQMLLNTKLNCNQENCKAIILYEADKLSADALSYIKWMLEKFKGCNKVFFCCKDAKKLHRIMPLCRLVQLNKPSTEEIVGVLNFIAENEGIQLHHQLAYKIVSSSQNNLRQAIRSFEATWHTNASLTEDQDIKTGWEDKIANIAKKVLEEQSPKQLYIIRGELQNLIEHNVAPEFIFQTLKEELKKILPEQLQPPFHHLYDEYQYQKNHTGKKYLPHTHQEDELGEIQNDQRKNVRKFLRIEEFIARFMSWYKGFVAKDLVFCADQQVHGG
ncbi:replication factor C subunit 3-like isoform X2 [Salvia divinorum]|uniref:Replication factor C subunit 3-like isoform X2 n=1 Tax=Salvia divinorum TaxID=28513 RepID=A0ABD1I3Z2_SALDI